MSPPVSNSVDLGSTGSDPLAPVDRGLFDRVVAHLLAAAAKAPAYDEPFPHTLIPDLFPADVYGRIQAFLPDPNLYTRFSYGKHQDADGVSNRRRFQLDQQTIAVLDAERQTFWRTIRNAIGSEAFKRAVFDRVRAGLKLRYGVSDDDVTSLPGYALPELFHESASYQIAPHPDTRRKVVTMQIALPVDDSFASMGTEFYRRSLRPSHWSRPPKGFEVAKTMPFVPNTAYAFSVLNTVRLKSWHGRSQMNVASTDDRPVVRNSILNIWYERIEDANAEIVADNTATPARRAA